ncbi:SMI1/KNR4 family protein [Streptomyces sp. SID10853]|uniref:SMI1/KNR4 family protein n=1 Tax=Streptomyces sp. SID10853 TaxID=2706028 RepID=UPI001EF37E09|nr:SMI1/KNR4 family protein [Streptomyces sp. SID10853]
MEVTAARLADDPDLGLPSGLPGILTVTVAGDLFEDCPALAIGYIREPERTEIRYVALDPSAEAATDAQDQRHQEHQQQEEKQRQPADPASAAITVRQVADAWHRITGWLQKNTPDSYAALREGADPGALAALEGDLGLRIPVELRVLWLLTAGDDGVNGSGCLPGNHALMTLDEVAAVHRMKMDSRTHHATLSAGCHEDERITVWEPTWIPVVALGAADSTSGLYLDAATGYLGQWSRYDEYGGDVLDTLVTYLEEAADMLDAPALAARDEPGLIGGALVWLSRVDPAQQGQWQSLTG